MNAMDREPGEPLCAIPAAIQSDLDRLRDLRTLRASCLRQLRRLRKRPERFRDEIAREEAILSSVNREIEYHTRLLTDLWN